LRSGTWPRPSAGLLLPLIDRAATFIQAALPRAIEIGRAALVRIRAAFAAVGAWWERNGPAITAFVQRVFGAIRDWVADVAPAIRSWVHNVLGDLSNWWEDHGPMIIRIAKDVAGRALAKMIRGGVRAAQFIVDHWSEAWPVIKKVATVIHRSRDPGHHPPRCPGHHLAARQAAAWVISQAGPIATRRRLRGADRDHGRQVDVARRPGPAERGQGRAGMDHLHGPDRHRDRRGRGPPQC
jgi:hypothetical protein